MNSPPTSTSTESSAGGRSLSVIRSVPNMLRKYCCTRTISDLFNLLSLERWPRRHARMRVPKLRSPATRPRCPPDTAPSIAREWVQRQPKGDPPRVIAAPGRKKESRARIGGHGKKYWGERVVTAELGSDLRQ